MTTASPADSLIDVPPGLKGVAVTATGIGDVRGSEGFYHYRQYAATELARHRSLEDVWQLVLDGHLPADADERGAFAREVGPLRALPA
ncbi:citrate synthase/methylcitrate synthase, partial [Acidimicrobiaceae bacterium USS-CC1]|nr:citrate synthase/methylcitrate synthase [Acidiferrimicrobium australe]